MTVWTEGGGETGAYTDDTAPGADTLWTEDGHEPGTYPEDTPFIGDAANPITGWYHVENFGALGDGIADDTVAIQACLNAVPDVGGKVYFRSGDYLISSPLYPKSRTFIEGTHVPRYMAGPNPESSCKIRCAPGFVGIGMIVSGNSTRSVAIRHLALVGNHQGVNVHGIKMPTAEDNTGEQGWMLDAVSIVGCTGSGIYGRLHVWVINNCHFAFNKRYAWESASGTTDKWNDMKISNCYIFFNRMGGVLWDGGITAGIEVVNCRFERSGQTGQNPNNAPVDPEWNANAAGIRIRRGQLIYMTNISTDANTGPGIEIESVVPGQASALNNIFVTNSSFGRDCGGDQYSPPDTGGVRVKGFSIAGPDLIGLVKFTNCNVISGRSDDSGGTGPITPFRGIHYENTTYFQWLGGSTGHPGANDEGIYQGVGGTNSNYRPLIIAPDNGYFTPALFDTTVPQIEGSLSVDAGKLYIVKDGAHKEIGATPATIDTTEVNISNVAGVGRELNFQSADVNRWKFLVNGNPELSDPAGSDLSIVRYNNAGVSLGEVVEWARFNGYGKWQTRNSFRTEVVIGSAVDDYTDSSLTVWTKAAYHGVTVRQTADGAGAFKSGFKFEDATGNRLFAVDHAGRLRFNSAIEFTTANAGAATLPANPVGFFEIIDSAGNARRVPYYDD